MEAGRSARDDPIVADHGKVREAVAKGVRNQHGQCGGEERKPKLSIRSYLRAPPHGVSHVEQGEILRE